MNSSEFYAELKSQFPFDVTVQQDIVLQQLSDFIFETLLRPYTYLKDMPELERPRLLEFW